MSDEDPKDDGQPNQPAETLAGTVFINETPAFGQPSDELEATRVVGDAQTAAMAGTVMMDVPAAHDTPDVDRGSARHPGHAPPLAHDDAAATRVSARARTPPPLPSTPPPIPPPAFGPPPSPEPPSATPSEPAPVVPAPPQRVPPPALTTSPRAAITHDAPALPPAAVPPPPDETRAPRSPQATTNAAAQVAATTKPQAVQRAPSAPSATRRWALPIALLAAAGAFGGYLMATNRRAPTPPVAATSNTASTRPATKPAAPTATAGPTAAAAVDASAAVTATSEVTATAEVDASAAPEVPATADGPPPLSASVAPATVSPGTPNAATAAAPAKSGDLAACVSQTLPLGTEMTSAALDFVCVDADAREAAQNMTVALAATSGVPPDTKRRWAGMGWFQMAGAQLVRSRCCGDVATMSGPPNLESCGTGAALGQIHRAIAAATSLDDAAKTYFTAVDCLFKANTAKMFGQRRRPNAAEQTSFVELSQGR